MRETDVGMHVRTRQAFLAVSKTLGSLLGGHNVSPTIWDTRAPVFLEAPMSASGSMSWSSSLLG